MQQRDVSSHCMHVCGMIVCVCVSVLIICMFVVWLYVWVRKRESKRTWVVKGGGELEGEISIWCVARDLRTIAPRPLECTCWRQFAALWGDCKKISNSAFECNYYYYYYKLVLHHIKRMLDVHASLYESINTFFLFQTPIFIYKICTQQMLNPHSQHWVTATLTASSPWWCISCSSSSPYSQNSGLTTFSPSPPVVSYIRIEITQEHISSSEL